jgi:hypothetical protein
MGDAMQGIMKRPRGIIAAGTLAVSAVLGAGVAAAPTASASVVFNYDGGTVHVGQYMQIGVWYQQYSGGTHHYWAGVYGPDGRLVFSRTGSASPDHWTFWHVKAIRRGHYHTLYITGGHGLRIVTSVRLYRQGWDMNLFQQFLKT